jgi:hypothetical protein
MCTRVRSFTDWAQEFVPMQRNGHAAYSNAVPVDTINKLPSKDLNRIWSIIDVEGDRFLRNGYFENALGYFFTAKPAPEPTLVEYHFV